MSSWWVLQTSQRTSRITCRRTRLVIEGKAFLQARHSRFLTLLGTFKFKWPAREVSKCLRLKSRVVGSDIHLEGPCTLTSERNLHFGYMARSRYQLVEFYTVGFFFVVEASKSSKEFSRISLLQVRDSWSMKLLTVAKIWWNNHWLLFHWEPIITPNSNWLAIPHSPHSSSPNNLSTFDDALPSAEFGFFCLHYWICGGNASL